MLFVVGKPNVHVKYMPGSAHNVTMYVGDLCVNDHLIAKQLAVRAKEMGKTKNIFNNVLRDCIIFLVSCFAWEQLWLSV